MDNLISSFTYYAGHTADRMGIPKEDTIARGCVELMFNVMLEQGRSAIMRNPLQKNTFTSDKTIEWITPRYNALKKYGPDFFKAHPDADRDAVTVAMLCTGHTHIAHVPEDNGGDTENETVFKNDTIPWDIVERAENIIDEAEKIAERVYGSRDLSEEETSTEEPAIESVFLAHAFLSDVLFQIRSSEYFEDYTPEDLASLKKEILAPVRNFALAYTAWGKDIIEHVGQFERYIDVMTMPDSIQVAPAPARPVLTLVSSQPTNP